MEYSRAKQILRLAIPLILQQLCLQLQLWIDRAMLGHLDSAFFSAIGNAGTPYHMIVSAITAVCCGTAILVAQSVGAGDWDRVRRLSGASFLGNTLFSVTAFVLFFFFCEQIFLLMGVQQPILEYSTAYMQVLAFSLLLLGPSATATAFLQGLGLTEIIMATGIAGNLLNIFLDWVLIFGKLGFPALSIRGAALATVLANFLSTGLILLFLLTSQKISVKPDLRKSPAVQLRVYRQVLKVGIPSGLEYALWNIGNLILVSFLNHIDTISAGIYTLVFSIETIPMLIYMGFANAGLTLVGQQTGAKDMHQARRTGLLCLYFSLAVCIVVGVIFHVIPRQLLEIFTDDSHVLTVSTPFLRFVSWILLPKAVNNVIGLCIRGIGDTRWMLYTQIFGTIFMIAAGYCFIFPLGFGLKGIFITLLCDESIRCILNLFHFLTIRYGAG